MAITETKSAFSTRADKAADQAVGRELWPSCRMLCHILIHVRGIVQIKIAGRNAGITTVGDGIVKISGGNVHSPFSGDCVDHSRLSSRLSSSPLFCSLLLPSLLFLLISFSFYHGHTSEQTDMLFDQVFAIIRTSTRQACAVTASSINKPLLTRLKRAGLKADTDAEGTHVCIL